MQYQSKPELPWMACREPVIIYSTLASKRNASRGYNVKVLTGTGRANAIKGCAKTHEGQGQTLVVRTYHLLLRLMQTGSLRPALI